MPTSIADGAAVTLIVVGSTTPKSDLGALIAVGSATYLLGGPITHASHGNWGRSAGSLALRAGTPIAGAMLGASSCTTDSGDCVDAVVGLAALGMLVALTLDLSLLHWKPRPQPTPVGLGELRPALAFDRHGFTLGAASTF